MTRIPGLRTAAGGIRALTRMSRGLNAATWDAQYAVGRWRYLDEATDGALPLEVLGEYVDLPSARILDLGCGTSANLPLRTGMYGHYHGVDISRKAIAAARALGRPNTSFEVADMATYDTDLRYDAVLLRQVLYYVPDADVPRLLRHYAGFLRPGGKMIVQIWDVVHSSRLVEAVRGCGLTIVREVVERPADGTEGVLIVFDR